ncbi:MAG: hypothetical protein JWM99_4934 [Verrucomicrobiales bacterium]|nr:hypothetical protein [Verrucomicrobiales bacterium]
MASLDANFYQGWHNRRFTINQLEDSATHGSPPERLLQQIWQHQRILRERLQTADGRKLKILHPGFWNHEAGPDFKSAIIQLDDAPPSEGDIEIDISPQFWRGHGHQANPAYERVILHVLWEPGAARGENLPTLFLKEFLDAPFGELTQWLAGESATDSTTVPGVCSAPLSALEPDTFRDLLNQAALVRMKRKAHLFEVRARHRGWEQSLWEGLFSGLGYKKNVWPMKRLAEMTPEVMRGIGSALQVQARLLGLGGFLPAEARKTARAVDPYVRNLWELWWRDVSQFDGQVFPNSVWKLSNMRPANNPARRLALAAHWLQSGNLVEKLTEWLHSFVPDVRLVDSLTSVLQAEDPFWGGRWTFRGAMLKQPQPLLGAQRVTDLAVNVVLPWFWSRASAGKNSALLAEIERRYFAWPAAEDNAVLRLARQRLLQGRHSKLFRHAFAQQGLIQIVRDFCDHSNALCEHCRFPELVSAVKQQLLAT